MLATIIRNYSSLPCLYEDPEYFYEECGYWWKIHKNNYAKMFLSMETEYKPLDNYNRIEERQVSSDNSKTISDNSSGTTNETRSGSATNSVTSTGTNTNTDTSKTVVDGTIGVTGNDTSETTVSAFNESTYQPAQKLVNNSTNNTDTDTTTTVDGSGTIKSDTKTDGTSSNNDTINTSYNNLNNGTELGNSSVKEKVNISGNIGVTTSQQMLKEELEVRLISIYNLIANQFADEMLLGVW